MKQKLFTLFLALVASIGIVLAWDYEQVLINGIYYNLDATNQVAEVTYKPMGKYYSGEVIIPESISYKSVAYNVASIGVWAFKESKGLTSVTIPNSVTSLAQSAFQSCSSLTSVVIPNSVTDMGDYTFRYCSSLENVKFPDNIRVIGSYAFQSCSSIMNIEIPNNVRVIGNYAFSNCTKLTNIVIPSKVTFIGAGAFSGCTELTSITIGEKTETIYNETTFSGCANLKTVTIKSEHILSNGTSLSELFGSQVQEYILDDSVTTLSKGLFKNCSSLVKTNIPKNVTTIEDSTFLSCISLTNMALGENITSIGDYAFYSCESLTSIDIPNNVASIGESAFSKCISLKNVAIGNSVSDIKQLAFNGCYFLESVKLNSNAITAANYSPSSSFNEIFGSQVKQYLIGDRVTSIGAYAFYNCNHLTSIDIPNSVTSIGNNAFSGCSGLKNVTIPNSVASIGKSAFYNCSALTSVNLPNSINLIPDSTFLGCSSLEAITIPENVKTLGESAFKYSGIESVNLSKSLRVIAKNTFSNCTKLKSIVIPNSVYSIGIKAFEECNSLNNVVLSDNLLDVSESAFSGCTSITSINLPYGLLVIGYKAFYGCSGVSSITIHEGLQYLGDYAFTGTSQLKLTFEGQTPPIRYDNSISYALDGVIATYVPCGTMDAYKQSFPQYTSNIKYHQLGYNIIGQVNDTKRGSVSVPTTICDNQLTAMPNYGYYFVRWADGVTDNPRTIEITQDSIFTAEFAISTTGVCGDDDQLTWEYDSISKTLTISGNGALDSKYTYGVQALNEMQNLVIEDGVTSVGDNAFRYCTSLVSVSIPNSVTSIGAYAFYNCNHLTSIDIPHSVTSIGKYAFYNAQNVNYSGPATGAPWGAMSVNNGTYVYSTSEISAFTSQLSNNQTSVSSYLFRGVISSVDEINTSYGNATFYITDGTTSFYCYRIYDYYSTRFTGTDQLKEGDVVIISSQVKNYKGTTPEAVQGRLVYHSANPLFSPDEIYYYGVRKEIDKEAKLYYAAVNDTLDIPENVTYQGNEYTVTEIANDAFYNRDSIKCVVLPRTIKVMPCAFEQCDSIETIYYNAENLTKPTTTPFIASKNTLKNVIIGETVSSLPHEFFNNLESITTVQFNAISCEDMEYSPFYYSRERIQNFAIANDIERIPANLCWGMINISEFSIPSSVSQIGKDAFHGCTNLQTLSLGENISSYGDSVFAGCSKLTSIYNYRPKPAKLGKGTFEDVDYFECSLFVLAGSVDMYKSSGSDWKDFYFVEPIGTQETTTTENKVQVETGDNTAVFTWPVSEDAETYSLQITKDGEVFCLLTFNANGQLVGIAFAPGRNGQASAPAAITSITGMSFTVTGLNYANKYAYHLTVQDASAREIIVYSGEFATNGYIGEINQGGDPDSSPTGIDDINSNTKAVKILHNGTLFILRGDKTYTLTGQEVK